MISAALHDAIARLGDLGLAEMYMPTTIPIQPTASTSAGVCVVARGGGEGWASVAQFASNENMQEMPMESA
jgi:hypothetical protein